jgi:hypothetical protein
VLIGSRPHTDWLPAEIARDRRGFVLTGEDLPDRDDWALERRPFSLETSMPGVLAAGDVRHASVKRVASAVGEGSIAIQQVQYLFADERLRSGQPTGDAAARRSVPGCPPLGLLVTSGRSLDGHAGSDQERGSHQRPATSSRATARTLRQRPDGLATRRRLPHSERTGYQVPTSPEQDRCPQAGDAHVRIRQHCAAV